MSTYNLNMALVAVEEACLVLKKEIADGSLLRGRTCKPKEQVSKIEVLKQTKALVLLAVDLDAQARIL